MAQNYTYDINGFTQLCKEYQQAVANEKIATTEEEKAKQKQIQEDCLGKRYNIVDTMLDNNQKPNLISDLENQIKVLKTTLVRGKVNIDSVNYSRSGNLEKINPALLKALYNFHALYSNKYPTNLNITSGVRGIAANDDIEGSGKFSLHIVGMAIDLAVPANTDIDSFYRDLYNSHYFSCVTPYYDQKFIHIDIRPSGDPWFGNYNDPLNYHASETNNKNTEKDEARNTQVQEVNKELSDAIQKAYTEQLAKEPKVEATQGTKFEFSKTCVLEFIKLIASTKFVQQWQSLFSNPGFSTIYTKIGGFINNFFYDFYTIPNLPNCKSLMTKPETIFGSIPYCNVILPCMKSDISFSRNLRNEPTRIFLETNPDYYINASDQTPGPIKLVTVQAMSSDNTVVHLKFNAEAQGSKVDSSQIPLYQITPHENLPSVNTPDSLGIVRVMPDKGGSELYTYMMAQLNDTKMSEEERKQFKQASLETLPKLATYMLLKSRYASRSGSISMYFNPYIVPGFPMVSIEKKRYKNNITSTKQDLFENTFTIYGYVTNVAHNLTDNQWSTTVTYSYGYFDKDATPDIYPILENDYKEENAKETYKKLLGCDGETNKNIISKFEDISDRDISIRIAYKRIKRTATTVAEWENLISPNNFSVKETENFSYLENPQYFNTVIQEKILQYSKRIYEDKLAFTVDDTR